MYSVKDRGYRYTTPAPQSIQTNYINSDSKYPYQDMSKYPAYHSYLISMFDKFDRNMSDGFFRYKQITPAPFFRIEHRVNSEMESNNG